MNNLEKKALTKSIIISLVVGVSMILISLLFLLFFDVVTVLSWTIGIAIGTLIETINILFMYLGANNAMKKGKTWAFLLFHFARMGLVLVGLAVTGLLGFGFFGISAVPIFHYSIFGLLIGYTPIQIIISIIEMSNKKKQSKQ